MRGSAKGVLPTTMEEVGGQIERIPAKARDFFQTPDDVYEFIYNGGTGLGEPLKRDPSAVAHDVSEGSTSPWAARELYGVVLEQVGEHDWVVERATETLRRDCARRAPRVPLFNRGSVSDRDESRGPPSPNCC